MFSGGRERSFGTYVMVLLLVQMGLLGRTTGYYTNVCPFNLGRVFTGILLLPQGK